MGQKHKLENPSAQAQVHSLASSPSQPQVKVMNFNKPTGQHISSWPCERVCHPCLATYIVGNSWKLNCNLSKPINNMQCVKHTHVWLTESRCATAYCRFGEAWQRSGSPSQVKVMSFHGPSGMPTATWSCDVVYHQVVSCPAKCQLSKAFMQHAASKTQHTCKNNRHSD